MARLRLHLTYDYEANPQLYGTDDPYKMAEIDHRNLVEGVMNVLEFLDSEGRLTYAIEPLP